MWISELKGLMNTFTAGERPLSEGYEKIAVPVPLQVRFPWVKGGGGEEGGSLAEQSKFLKD